MIDYPVYAPVLSSFVDLLIEKGVDEASIGQAAGLQADALRNLSTEPVSRTALHRIADLLNEHLDEDDFFLRFRLNNASAPRHFSTWMSDNCATLGEFLSNLCQYCQLTNIADSIRCENSANEIRLSYRNLSLDLGHRLYYEYVFSFLVSRIDRLTEGRARPSSVEFCYQEPENSEAYRRTFNCPVYFERSQSAIIYDNQAADHPIVGHDPHLFNTLKQQADLQLQNIDPKVLIFNVKALIMELVSQPGCNAETVASRLHMDKATLNRKLKRFGLSFQAILDNSRHELSRHYRSLGVSTEIICYRVGFTEVSSYKRALKRWEGKTR
ncbi:MAG: AraC family transcriptional regulator ligand-binding domain-containing protein [Cellvibrionaceae bacterium]